MAKTKTHRPRTAVSISGTPQVLQDLRAVHAEMMTANSVVETVLSGMEAQDGADALSFTLTVGLEKMRDIYNRLDTISMTLMRSGTAPDPGCAEAYALGRARARKEVRRG